MFGDEIRISQILVNLLTNGIKYTEQGTVSLLMEREADENGQVAIRFTVKDTGMGIAPEDLPRIFDKGYTGYNGRVDSKASGIGLYLCKRICTNLGHVIRAESIVDKGTEILIEFSQKRLFTE